MAKPIVATRIDVPPVHSSTNGLPRMPWVMLLCITLAGCASGSKLSTLPSDGPTMAEIYRQHMAGQRSAPANDSTRPQRGYDGHSEYGRYQRTVANEIDSRFTRLPNPDLVMYVTPHLSPNGRYPVPGYSTVFPMYETVEYAMPGEVPVRRATAESTELVRAQVATGSRAK